MKTPKSEFLELTRKLGAEARERVLSRMRKKLLHRYLENPFTEDDVIALQLEREAEALQAWQAKVQAMRLADQGPAMIQAAELAENETGLPQ